MKFILSFVVLLSLIWTSSCITGYNVVQGDYDEFKNIQRYVLKQQFRPKEAVAPVSMITHSLVKEISSNTKSSYFLYATLNANANSFALEKEFYISIDGDKKLKKIEDLIIENRNSISENSKQILTADSTKMNVITGYSNAEWRENKFKLELSDTDIAAIMNGEELKFRYYFGSEPATIRIRGKKLRKMKDLIARN